MHFIPPLTINMDTRKQTRSTEIQTNHFPLPSLQPILFFPANTPLTSHLKHPLLQSLSRFTGIGFLHTKRNQFCFQGVLTTIIQPQSTRGCGLPVGTGLSTPQDRAIMDRSKMAGRRRRLTGHKYVHKKLCRRDVSSCRFFLWRKGLSPLHAVGVINVSCIRRCG